MNEAWIALFAAIFGGVGLKTIETLLGRGERKESMQTQFRDELRLEIEALRKELRLVDEKLAYWRERYYDVMSALALAKSYLASEQMYDALAELEVRGVRAKREEPDQD